MASVTAGARGVIDRTSTRLEDALAANGNQTGTLVMYDVADKTVAANAQVTTAVTVLGLLIIAIRMVALVNTSDGETVGLVALEDLLEQVIGQFDDETDPIIAAHSAARPTPQQPSHRGPVT